MPVEIASLSERRLLPSLLLLLAACGSDGGAEDAADAADSTTDATGSGSADGSGTATCITFDGSAETPACAEPATTPAPAPGPARDPACTASSKWVTSISGTVLDEAGAPVGCAKAQVCVRAGKPARLTCLRPVATAQDGTFTIPVGSEVQCMASATLRIFSPGQPFATIYCGVDLSTQEGDVTLPETGRLFRLKQPRNSPAFCDGATPQSVALDGDLSLEVIPDRLSDAAGDLPGLTAAKVDPAAAGLCFLGTERPAALYAFGPEVDVSGDGFSFTLPNDLGLAAGATAKLFVLGGLSTTVGSETVEEGEWHLYGEATVSADGTMLEATGANGLPYLSWLGVAP